MTFDGGAGFAQAIFSHAGFNDATFRGDVRFAGAAFSGTTTFFWATFSGKAIFSGAKFSGDAAFNGAIFSGDAWFLGAKFSGDAGFSGAFFSGKALFYEAIFSGDVDLYQVLFRRLAEFRKAKFEQARRFGPVLAYRGLDLDDIEFTQPVQIEASATGVCCRRARFPGGVQFLLRWARVVLSRSPEHTADREIELD